MKTKEENKRNIWVSLVLSLMLITLLAFSLLPIINNFTKLNQSGTNTDFYQQNISQLETQAQGYETVLQREPDNQTALRGLLDIRLQLGDLPSTITPLERLAKLHPEISEYSILLAQTQQQLQDWNGAENTYRQLINTHPADMNALQGLVNLLLEQNRGAEAVSLIQEAIKKPRDSETTAPSENRAMQLLLAQVYALQKQPQEAITIYDQLIEADQEDFRPLLAKGLVLRDNGKKTEAITLFEAALKVAPEIYKPAIQNLSIETSSPAQNTEQNTEQNPAQNPAQNSQQNPSPSQETDTQTNNPEKPEKNF